MVGDKTIGKATYKLILTEEEMNTVFIAVGKLIPAELAEFAAADKGVLVLQTKPNTGYGQWKNDSELYSFYKALGSLIDSKGNRTV